MTDKGQFKTRHGPYRGHVFLMSQPNAEHCHHGQGPRIPESVPLLLLLLLLVAPCQPGTGSAAKAHKTQIGNAVTVKIKGDITVWSPNFSGQIQAGNSLG